MLEAIYGYVVTQSTESIVIGPGDVGPQAFGFAYRVYVVKPELWLKDTHYSLLLHHQKSETADALYGFGSHDDRALFRDLIDCDGVGPKAAMNVMRLGTVNEISQMIRMGNPDALRRAKGVNKGADNIVLKLQKRYVQKGIRTDDLI